MRLTKIVSGGQTGADRAALDFALEKRISHGGWCPKGRKAEDGRIPSQYQLQETPSSRCSQRTEWNVRDSDGTVVFSIAARLRGGSEKTANFARRYRKPLLQISQQVDGAAAEMNLRRFISQQKIKTLNVAGPRASDEPQVYEFVRKLLSHALGNATQER